MSLHSTDSPVVLVTGAARRIGAAIAEYFHNCGCRVIIHCNRSRNAARELAVRLNESAPGTATVIQADLTDQLQLDNLAQQSLAWFERLDIVINNASSFYPTPWGTIDRKQWQDLLDSNLSGPLFLCQLLSDELQARRGAIVNIIDIYAQRPRRGYSSYSIAKGGLQTMTRALAEELAPRVRVNGVSPGAILWPEDDSETDPESREKLLATIPLGRSGNATDVAALVYFLATQASYVTGEVISVDGGRRLNL